jgi:hypothetical protein
MTGTFVFDLLMALLVAIVTVVYCDPGERHCLG